MIAPAITEELLELFKEYLQYNPTSGILTWRKSVGRRGVVGGVAGSISCGYHRFKLFGKNYMSHRVAYCLYHNTTLKSNELIDHKDGNTLNMREENLRKASVTQNRVNTKPRSTKTGHHNISQEGSRFRVIIRSKIGRYNQSFGDLQTAIRLRDIKLKEIFGDFHAN